MVPSPLHPLGVWSWKRREAYDSKIAYLQAWSGQYIDTLLTLQPNTRIEASWTQKTTDIQQRLFGLNDGASAGKVFACYINNNGYWAVNTGTSAGGQVVTVGADVSYNGVFDLSTGFCMINSVPKSNGGTPFSSANTIPLFARKNNGNTIYLDYPAKMQLFWLKIYQNDALVRDFIPVRRGSQTVGTKTGVSLVVDQTLASLKSGVASATVKYRYDNTDYSGTATLLAASPSEVDYSISSSDSYLDGSTLVVLQESVGSDDPGILMLIGGSPVPFWNSEIAELPCGGLWDKVNEKWYSNSGGEYFKCGPDVNSRGVYSTYQTLLNMGAKPVDVDCVGDGCAKLCPTWPPYKRLMQVQATKNSWVLLSVDDVISKSKQLVFS